MLKFIMVSVICVSSFMFGSVANSAVSRPIGSNSLEVGGRKEFRIDKTAKVPTLFICSFFSIGANGELTQIPPTIIAKLGLTCAITPIKEIKSPKPVFKVCGKSGALCREI